MMVLLLNNMLVVMLLMGQLGSGGWLVHDLGRPATNQWILTHLLSLLLWLPTTAVWELIRRRLPGVMIIILTGCGHRL